MRYTRHGFEAGSLYDRVERFSYQFFDGQLSGGLIIIDAGHIGALARLFVYFSKPLIKTD